MKCKNSIKGIEELPRLMRKKERKKEEYSLMIKKKKKKDDSWSFGLNNSKGR